MEIPTEQLTDSALAGNFNQFFPLLAQSIKRRSELTETEKKAYLKELRQMQNSLLELTVMRTFKESWT